MNYFLVLLPVKDNDKRRDFRAQHLSFLETMRHSGRGVANGKVTDDSGGIIIYKAKFHEACEAVWTGNMK